MTDRPLSHRHLPAAALKLDPREVHMRAPSHRAGLSLFLRYLPPGRALSLVLAGTLKAIARAAGLVAEWRARSRSRRELMALDDRLLQDIGLGRGDAYMEYSKPFWRKEPAPAAIGGAPRSLPRRPSARRRDRTPLPPHRLAPDRDAEGRLS